MIAAERAELVARAGETIRAGSRSFHMASRLFDRRTRERAWLLYAWCRHCDDVCDNQRLGQGKAETPKARVSSLQEQTARALAGERTGELAFDALRQLVAECPVPRRFIQGHLRGFELDAEGWRPRDEADLVAYCYHVAGVVGCMMAVVMGIDPQDRTTLERASELGIAFQLSNIARDIRDDHETGRCYLPVELAREHRLDLSDPLRPDQRDRLVAVAARLVSLAEDFERSADGGIPRLPFRARWAVLAAGRIYGSIGRRVVRLGPSAWDRRTVVPRRHKLAFLVPSLVGAVRTGKGG